MKKLLIGLFFLTLSIMMVLPLALVASGEEGGTVEGYVISNDGYESRWVGSSIISASYGSWVKTDGDWNGCFQWVSNKDKVLYDSEAGTLTFQDGLNYNCKIYPAQSNYITTGGVFFSLDVFYQAPNEDDAPGTNSNFSGMILTDHANNGDRNLLCVLPDGGVKTNRYNAQEPILFEMEEGWNTIIMYIIPYLNDSGSVCNKVYLNVANDVNIVPDTKGITKADLDEYYYCYEYSNGKYFSELGNMFYMRPYANNEASKKDNLTIRNAIIKNLEGGNIPSAEESLYKVVYSGYPEIGYSYVPAGGGYIVIPKAYDTADDGTLDYVPYWTAGEEPNLQFYKPGDTVRIMDNMLLKRATESQLRFADLIAAYSKVDVSNLERYTYQEILTVYNEILACQDAVLAVGGSTTSNEYIKSEGVCIELEDRMEEIANAAEELMNAAAIFTDYNAMIDDRVTAFEEVMGGTYDATYSDECATAINQLNSFSATYEAIYENLAQFNARIQQLQNADASTERGTIIMGIIDNLMVIRRAGIADATLNYDKTLIETEYGIYLEAEYAAFQTLTTLEAMEDVLTAITTEYNNYKKVMYGASKKREAPTTFQQMVTYYNQYSNSEDGVREAELILDDYGNVAEIEYHRFSGPCDTTCLDCDMRRVTEVGHTFDNNCDAICNGCGGTRSVPDHVYDNVSDAFCNACGQERAVPQHVYSNACDAFCNECDAEREVPPHEYDNACDVYCNECQAERVPPHVYDNACDTKCNVCDEAREVEPHVYDNACDTKCNVCDAGREVSPHVYDNACDKKCNVCDEKRTTQGHVYENDCDTTCEACHQKRDVDGHEDEDGDQYCDHCRTYVPSKGAQNGGNSTILIVVIAVVSTLLVCGGVFTIVIISMKKKQNNQ